MRTLLLVCCGFLLVGCGGSGGGGTTPPPDPQFTGTWAGTWDGRNSPPPGNAGNLNLVIAENGDITGTATNDLSETGQIEGDVDAQGKVLFEIDYPSHDCEVYGTLTVAEPKLVGKLNAQSEAYNHDPQSRTIHIYSFRINLTRQP